MEEELKQRMEFQCAGGSVVVVSSEKIIMSRNQYGTYCTLMCITTLSCHFRLSPVAFGAISTMRDTYLPATHSQLT